MNFSFLNKKRKAGWNSESGSVISGILNSEAQNNATSSASASQRAANATNLAMFQQSRGSGGSAVLPTYLKGFESNLGSDLVSGYAGTNVPLNTFQTAVAPLAPAQGAANKFTNDIFNGGITGKLLAEAQPVQQARVASSMDALNKTLDAIDAAQAGKGFSGDSFGNREVQFQGREAQGNAGVANLAENQQIENYGNVTLPMNNLTLPASMAAQAGQFAFEPQNAYLQSLQSRMQPFNFLRLQQQAPFQTTPLPTGVSTSAGAGALAGLDQAGGTALNYYLQQQQQKNLIDAASRSGQSSGVLADYNGNGVFQNLGAAGAAGVDTSAATDAAATTY